MAEFVLYHGNKNYSSWSMRAWLALRLSAAEFVEVGFHLGQPDVRERIREVSPTGRVPALHRGDLVIWDSLAICEYLAERFPDAGLWPADRAARAVARSISAEMHSGFPALRARMPFNVRRASPGKGRTAEVLKEIGRIQQIWRDCRAGEAASDGPFLFGAIGIADVMFAPVVSRFRTYAVELDASSTAYADAIWENPHVIEWRSAAGDEPWVEPEFDL